jgi:hypothetical protein
VAQTRYCECKAAASEALNGQAGRGRIACRRETLDRYRQQFRRAHRKIAGYAERRIVSTPALDALAARGSRLTAAYAIADLRSGLR